MDEAERRAVAEFFGSQQEDEGRAVAEFWESLGSADRRQILLAVYRCRHQRGCHLLSVFRLPGGRFFYKPPVSLPPAVAVDRTTEAARAKNTSDGFRRWNGYAGSLDRLIQFCSHAPDSGGLTLECPHVRSSLVTAARLDADTSGHPGNPAPILWP